MLIIDDSPYDRSRSKWVELLARVWDHSADRFLKGFRMLTIFWPDIPKVEYLRLNYRSTKEYKMDQNKNIILEDLKNMFLDKCTSSNRNVVIAFTDSDDFRLWVEDSYEIAANELRWESPTLFADGIKVYPVEIDIIEQISLAFVPSLLFPDEGTLFAGLCQLVFLFRRLHREGIYLDNVQHAPVYYAIKRTGRDGLLWNALELLMESEYEDSVSGKKRFVEKKALDKIVRDLQFKGIIRIDSDKLFIEDKYLDKIT